MDQVPRCCVWLAALASCLVILGCVPDETDRPDKTRIRLSGYSGNPAETDLLSTLITEFNASQRDVEAIYEPVPGQYYAKILTMLVAGTAPDVFYLDIAYFRPFVAKRILLPLGPYLEGSATRKEDFFAALYEAFAHEGRLYGIPKDFNTLALFYNKGIFDQWKVAYPDLTWDLATLRRVSAQLTHRDGDGRRQYGFALTHDDVDRYLPVARMFGATLFAPAGQCAIDSPQARTAMDYYAGLKLTDQSAIYPSEVGTSKTYDVFGRGVAAMVFEGGWLVPYLRTYFPDVRFGSAELPAGPAGRSNFLFTVAYVIPRTSRQPRAAWKLIEFLTSERIQERVTFALPSRHGVAERYVQRHPEYRPILDAVTYAVPYEFGVNGDRVKERLGAMVQEVFLGAKDTQSALKEAARDIDQINRL
jgi:multiple sugar transport system substrate-binding protein